jgi:hypothetical protein
MARKLSKPEVTMLNFLGKRLSGSLKTINKHLERAKIIATAIDKRFGKNVYQYQVKHLKWFLNHFIDSYAKGTKYNYWLTVKLIISFIGKSNQWLVLLRGDWLTG